MDALLEKVREFVFSEIERTGMPLKQHVELSRAKGVELAKKMKADETVVEIGTLLMDCMIGQAIQEKRLGDHVDMSLAKTEELLLSVEISEGKKENIRHCVLEHHGSKKFFSLESEICCNADCYRFASVKGFIYAMQYLRDMPFEDLISLVSDKADEKWGLVSLEGCRNEIMPEYQLVKKILLFSHNELLSN